MIYNYTSHSKLLTINGDMGQAYKQLDWYSTDSEAAFNANREAGNLSETQLALTPTYQFNSQGYRSVNVSDITGKFFIAMGCSYTEGVGIELEQTWSHILSKKLGMQMLNLGMGGAGLDAIVLNTKIYVAKLLNQVKGFPLPKPDFVIVQHPHLTRHFNATIQEDKIHLQTADPNSRGGMNKFLVTRDAIKDLDKPLRADVTDFVLAGMYTDVITMLWNSAGVPVYHWTFNGDGENYSSMYEVLEFPADATTFDKNKYEPDRGRDNAHDGPMTNSMVAEELYAVLSPLIEQNILNMPKYISRRNKISGAFQ